MALLGQTDERQNSDENDNKADDIDDTVHKGFPLYCAP
jgi:hypothetical protein